MAWSTQQGQHVLNALNKPVEHSRPVWTCIIMTKNIASENNLALAAVSKTILTTLVCLIDVQAGKFLKNIKM